MISSGTGLLVPVEPVGPQECNATKASSTMNNTSCPSTLKMTGKDELRQFMSTKSVGSALQTKVQTGLKGNSTTGPILTSAASLPSCATSKGTSTMSEKIKNEKCLPSTTKSLATSEENEDEKSLPSTAKSLATSEESTDEKSLPSTTKSLATSARDVTFPQQLCTQEKWTFHASCAVRGTSDNQTHTTEHPGSQLDMPASGRTCTQDNCDTVNPVIQQINTVSVLKLSSNAESTNVSASSAKNCTCELSSNSNNPTRSCPSTCDLRANLIQNQPVQLNSSTALLIHAASAPLEIPTRCSTGSESCLDCTKKGSEKSTSPMKAPYLCTREGETPSVKEPTVVRATGIPTGDAANVASISRSDETSKVANWDLKASNVKSCRSKTSTSRMPCASKERSEQVQNVKGLQEQTNLKQETSVATTIPLKQTVPVESSICQLSRKLEGLSITTDGLKVAAASTSKMSTSKAETKAISLTNLQDGAITSVTPYSLHSRRDSTR